MLINKFRSWLEQYLTLFCDVFNFCFFFCYFLIKNWLFCIKRCQKLVQNRCFLLVILFFWCMICIQKRAFVDFHEEFEILMPNDTKSIQNRQFLGQCEFPLEKKKKISDFDKKSGSDGVVVVVGSSSYFISFNLLSDLVTRLYRRPCFAGRLRREFDTWLPSVI